VFVNDAGVARTTRHDRPSHEMIAHVPLLLHPDPHRMLLIGYGIGLTSHAAAIHGVDVDVVELSPGVRSVSRWFTGYNDNVLSDPRVHLRIDDGRNYVLGTQQKYDVIQAGIIHPGLNSGNAGFYSLDFYQQCKRILNPGGIVCQWLPLHSMPLADFKMLIRSFQAEFPHTSIWFKYTGDFCILIGTEQPLRIDFASLERRVSEDPVKAQLAQSDVVNVYDLLSGFCAADDDVRNAIGTGPLNTDDRPTVEFHCSRPYPSRAHVQAVVLLRDLRRSPWPLLYDVPAGRQDEVRAKLDQWGQEGGVLLDAIAKGLVMSYLPPDVQDFQIAYVQAVGLFDSALHLNPDDANARFLRRYYVAEHAAMLGSWLYRLRRVPQALAVVQPFADIGPPISSDEAEAQYIYRDIRRHASGGFADAGQR
jgi:spermidine synthase